MKIIFNTLHVNIFVVVYANIVNICSDIHTNTHNTYILLSESQTPHTEYQHPRIGGWNIKNEIGVMIIK